LSHPNIVDYYGIEVHRDRVYIFQEYCEGGSLANLISFGRVEDEEVVMLYAYQMLDGLQYLHSKGVEHRDVKPDSKSVRTIALPIVLTGICSQISFLAPTA
jgi:mitogen-activated protein kinase kinase kinase